MAVRSHYDSLTDYQKGALVQERDNQLWQEAKQEIEELQQNNIPGSPRWHALRARLAELGRKR